MLEFHGIVGGVLQRTAALECLRRALRRSPAVALLGPRQCGKSTLARQLVPQDSLRYFDLEDPASLGRLESPRNALEKLRGVVVIDEIQRRPDLFPLLRVLCDRRPLPARFLVLGSASPQLLRQSPESLAGRLELVPLSGFDLSEVGAAQADRLWLRGGFPRSYLARSGPDSMAWRRDFVQTFLERDLPALGVTMAAPALLRFWTMLAHTHGDLWKASDPARALALSEPTVRRYLDLMTGLYLVRQLPPWFENIGKRQVRSPKVYLRDSGILHRLLGLGSMRDLLAHPKAGASWEGFVIEEVLRVVEPDEAYFWRTHTGAELDLLLIHRGRRLGVEIKRSDAPTLTPSMRSALADLHLDALAVIHPGSIRYTIAERVEAVPAAVLAAGDPDALFPPERPRRVRSRTTSTGSP